MQNSTVLQRVVAVGLSVTTIAWLAGLALLVPLFAANAQTIVDGDLIRGSNSLDVYIVKLMGAKKFRRLILNPAIFNSYAHLKWENVKVVEPSVVSQYSDSQLVRSVSGTKVYQLSPTGEDDGQKRWLNMTADQFVADGNDWDSVYIINVFEENLYVSGADIAAGQQPAPVAGEFRASLSANTQAAATVPNTADNLPYGTWLFQGSGTINSLTFVRKGVGNPSTDFDNVYLYQGAKRLTSGRVISTTTNEVVFGSLAVAVNGSTELSLRAEVSGASGNVNYFELKNVGLVGGGSVAGLPVAANALTFGGQVAGTITVADTGSVSNPFVGAKSAEVTRFTLASSSEDMLVKHIRLVNSGTVNTTELTNVWAEIDGVAVSDKSNGGADDYIDINFSGNGYLLERGKTKTVRLYADVGGESSQTVILYVEESPDVLAIGQTYGFGVQTTISGFDSSASGEAFTLTLQGGDVTIAFNGPSARRIGDDTDDSPFLDLAITAQNDIDVRQTRLHLCFDDTGNGTFDDVTDAVLAEIEDTKIVDADSGVVLNGPVDGSSWTNPDTADVGDICGSESADTDDAGQYTFLEDWEVNKGQTRNISFRLDVEAVDDIVDGDILMAVLEGWGDLAGTSGNITVMRYRATNTAVDDSDIVPSSDIRGNNMTIDQSSLTVARATTPVSDTYVTGQQNIEAAGLVFTAGDASDITLRDLTLDVYVDDVATTATASFTNGITQNLSGPDILVNIELVDKATGVVVGGPQGYTSNSSTDDEVQFTGLSWKIPAGQSKTLIVRADVSTTAPSGANDGIYFDIDATTGVSSIDMDGNTRNANAANPLDGDVVITVTASGTLTLGVGNDTPVSKIVVQGTGKAAGAFDDVGEGAYLSDVQANAADEAFNIDKITLENTGSNGGDSLLQFAFDYQDVNGNWKRVLGTPDAANEVTLNLAPAWYIPKDDARVAKVYGSIGERTDGSDSTDQVNGTISIDATADDQFRAVGVASGSVLDDDDVSAVTAVNAMHVFNTKPSFEFVAGVGSPGHVGATLVAASNQRVATFKIKADAHHDVLFTSASGSLEFDMTASGDGTSFVITLYKSDGTILSSRSVTDSASTFAFGFEENNLTVPAGGSVQLYIEANLTSFNDTDDNFGLQLNRDETDNVRWLDEDNASFDVLRNGPANVIDGLPISFGTAVK